RARRRRARHGAPPRLARAHGPRGELLLPREVRPRDRGVEPRHGGGIPRRDPRGVLEDAPGAGRALTLRARARSGDSLRRRGGGRLRGPRTLVPRRRPPLVATE